MLGGGLGGVLGIEADGDDFEVLAGIERDGLQAAGQAVQDLGAEHGAAVIDGRQDHRLAALEEGGERNVAAGFVLEVEVERDLLIEPLIDADAYQRAGEGRLQIAVLHSGLLRGAEQFAGLGEGGGGQDASASRRERRIAELVCEAFFGFSRTSQTCC